MARVNDREIGNRNCQRAYKCAKSTAAQKHGTQSQRRTMAACVDTTYVDSAIRSPTAKHALQHVRGARTATHANGTHAHCTTRTHCNTRALHNTHALQHTRTAQHARTATHEHTFNDCNNRAPATSRS
jgi:hypothetical protein